MHLLAKEIIAMNIKIVTFFNASHYWSGQLEEVKKTYQITHSLKTYTSSRWYSLIMQCMSLKKNQYVYVMQTFRSIDIFAGKHLFNYAGAMTHSEL